MLDDILGLAYMQDPKVFDRDGATRRSKQRADLKAETGSYYHCVMIGVFPLICCIQQGGTMNKSKDGGLC